MPEHPGTLSHEDPKREQQLEAVIADYIRACEVGTGVDRQELLERHPELTDDLRAFFAQRDRMNEFAAPIRGFSETLLNTVGPGKHIGYVGDYELLEEIARGGMGIVYKARQKTLGRIVAVKMIASGRLATLEDVKRFQTEAQAAASLQHPHIVAIHEVGQHKGSHYFSMDYIVGRDLSSLLRENLLPAREAASSVHQMAEAIHYAHQQGTLHRDLKPSNVMIDQHDQVWITDFGLAMRIEGSSDLTRTGQIMGTPSYMSPEQAQGQRSLIGVASDVYSLGAILYECLTGRAPFRAASVIETIQQVIHIEAPSPRLLNPKIPRDLETICLKCLEKEPHRRYGTAQLLADDLQRFLKDEPISARPIGRFARGGRWCRRKPVVAGLLGIIATMLVFAVVVGLRIRQTVLEQQKIARAESLVTELMHADTTLVPSILAEIEPYRQRAETLLQREFQKSANHSVEKLHSALALLSSDESKIDYLRDEMLTATPTQFLVLRGALLPHQPALVEPLWTVAADADQEVARRFQAACALATYAPNDERWQSIRRFVCERLVSLEASELVAWRLALRPARVQLVEPLADIHLQPAAREQARIYATETLADFAGDDPEILFALLTDAEPFQFAVIFKALQKHREAMLELGRAALTKPPAESTSEDEKESLARRQANAAIALYQLGATDHVWPLLRQSANPRARSDFIHWLGPRGGNPLALVQRLEVEPDISICRAIVLTLGEFSETQLPLADRPPLIEKLLALYEQTPDAGLHAAAEWLLRTWGKQDAILAVNEKLMGRLPPESQQWYINMQGQTFVILEPGEFDMGSPLSEADRQGSELQHRRQIGERFAMAAHEVTQSQFRAFKGTHPRIIPPKDGQNPGEWPQVVTWYEATAYCNWLSEREGLPENQWCYAPNSLGQYADDMKAKPKALELRGYRLPTEAEWEYACRAGTVTSRYYGSAEPLLPNYAWYQFNRNNQFRPVGLLKPNDNGLFDMLGNAYEWCQDPYREYSSNPLVYRNNDFDQGSIWNKSRRVLRGGAYIEHPLKVRSALRVTNHPDNSASIEGFRPTRSYWFPTSEERAAEAAFDPVVKRQIDLLQLRDDRSVAAANKLGELGAAAVPALPALTSALNDHFPDSLSWQLQAASGQALGRMGPPAVPVLLKAITQSDVGRRGIANKALAMIEQSPAEAALAIRPFLVDMDPSLRCAAVLALRRLGGEPSVFRDLEARLKDDDTSVRQAAAFSLGANGTRAVRAIPALIDALCDKHPLVVRAALAALMQIGPRSDEVILALVAVAEDSDNPQQKSALAALGQIGPVAKSALPVVQSMLSDENLGVQAVARQTFRRIDAQLAARKIGPVFDPVAASQQDRATLRVGPRDWPQWGGSRLRNNTPPGQNIPISWDIETGRNIKRAAKLGSQTYGNPSVANGKVYIGTNNAAGYLARYPSTVDLGVMLCFEEKTGQFLWQYSSEKLPTGRVHDWPQVGMPSTPLVDGDRVWAVTNRCEVVCLDAEGFRDKENDGPFRDEANQNPDEADVVWRFNMMKELGVSPHNMSNCSILMANGLLFVCTSNGLDESHVTLPAPDAPSFLALEQATGKVIWTDNSPGKNILHSQWASPSYAVLGGQAQVLFAGGDGWLYSFHPAGDGQGKSKLLWKFDCNPKDSKYILGGRGTRNELIGFACIYDGLVYIATGQDPEHGEGAGLLWCLDPTRKLDGSDVSAELVVDRLGEIVPHRRLCAVDPVQGERAIPNPNSAVVWQFTKADRNADDKIDFEEEFHRSLSTPVIEDDILYIADFSGLFHCLNAKTGEVHWTYDLFAACWGSALLVDGKVYIGDEDGDVVIFRHSADPKIALPQGVPLAEINMDNSIYSTPIVANNILYIANKNTLYAIETGEGPLNRAAPSP